MPVPLSSLSSEPLLRVLLIGPWGIWKTTTAITTSPQPVRVILCENDTALNQARRLGADSYADMERALDHEKPFEQMTGFLAKAKQDAQAGEIKTLIIDPLDDFCDRLLAQSFKQNLTGDGHENGKVAYNHYSKRLIQIISQALAIPCNVIFIAPFVDMPGQPLGAKKTGDGIVPNIPGNVRLRIGYKFHDVLWMDVDPSDSDKRVFYTSPTGAWGPKCRSLPGQYDHVPADFNEFIRLSAIEKPGAKKTAAPAKPMQKPAAAPPKPVTPQRPMTNGAAKPPMKPPMKPPTQQVKR